MISNVASSDAAGPAATTERIGHVAVITLNRPGAMNAVNGAVSAAVGDALTQIADDPDLRVAVVTGAGRAFCAGADLKALAAGENLMDQAHPERGFAGMINNFIDKPVIAAVNGLALGGGTEIVLACDLAVMSEDATLGLPEVKRGLLAAGGGMLRLPRQVPLKLALEVLLTGDPINAPTALRFGLVNRVVPATDVVSAALELAERIAANAPLAVQASKRVAHQVAAYGSDWTDEDLWSLNSAEFRAVMRSADFREGTRAFAEKRTPQWRGC